MTRIMAWNIQFFTDQNFVDATGAESLSGQHIVSAVQAVNPDILVVIEVRSGGSGGLGSLITDTGGAAGVRTLLGKLGGGWACVPPLVLNAGKAPYQETQSKYFEGIGVFFQTANLDFIGPALWTGNKPQPRNLTNPPANIQAYGTPWAGALPATQPAGCGFQGKNQNQFAGQVIFYDGGQQLEFPAKWARTPFYTAFWDKVNNRVVKLLSVHLPPKYTWSKQAMRSIGKINLQTQIPSDSVNQDNQGVMLVLGDFNVNENDPNQFGSYSEGNLAGYTKTLDLDSELYPGEVATMIRRAVPRTTPPYLRQQARAGNGWWKKDKTYDTYLALDNILMRYYPAANGVHGQILDWPPLSPRPYTPRTNAYMDRPFTYITSDNEFAALTNYGKMRGASDHLAMVIDV